MVAKNQLGNADLNQVVTVPILNTALERLNQQISMNVTRLFENLSTQISVNQVYSQIRQCNLLSNNEVRPLPNRNNQLPEDFPTMKRQYDNLTLNRVNYLLEFYGEPMDGTINDKRSRLKSFLNLYNLA
jgi:hypothetical protein